MENQIIINSRDLYIKELEDGREVVNLRGNTAFDSSFIKECKEKGVRLLTIDENTNKEED